MTINNGYYLIDPEDNLEQIKYLMDTGCLIVCRTVLFGDPKNYIIIHNRFGFSFDRFKLYKIKDFDPAFLKPLYVKF